MKANEGARYVIYHAGGFWGFKKEVDLRDCLQRIGAEIDSLKEKIDDTILLVGSEAYRSARLFYKTVKAAASEERRVSGKLFSCAFCPGGIIKRYKKK